jgi:glycerol-3-phosphate acyltransferase PlsY
MLWGFRWRDLGVIVGAYLVGAIPVGLWMGRVRRGVDVRNYGSGGTGATNVLRTLGVQAAALTFALDVAKGSVAVLIARGVTGGDTATPAAAGIAAIAGHSWPIFAGYRGGKGVATAFGALLALSPATAGAAGLGGLTALAATRRVSVASLAATITADVAAAATLSRPHGRAALAFALLATGIILGRHRENIGRIIRGSEPTIGKGGTRRGG